MTDVRRLDLNLVVVLDALLAARTITAASELLDVNTASVSAALGRLRDLFDDPLIQRVGSGHVLTPRAESLLPAVTAVMEEVRSTLDTVSVFDPVTSTRTFVIAASDYVLSELTSPLLSVLAAEAPSTRLDMHGLPLDASVSPVDLLRADVTISVTGRGVPGKQTSLFSDRIVCIVDAHHPALVDGALTLDTLALTPRVQSMVGPHPLAPVADMLTAAQIQPRVAISVEGLVPVPFAVVATGWVGWVPERIALRYAPTLGLTIAHTPIVPGILVEAAYWHPSKSNDPALQWLLKQLLRASEIVEFGNDAPQ